MALLRNTLRMNNVPKVLFIVNGKILDWCFFNLNLFK